LVSQLPRSSGAGPSGEGDNTIVVFDRSGALLTPHLVTDPNLSPLDLKPVDLDIDCGLLTGGESAAVSPW
jgi:hypothetical protein